MRYHLRMLMIVLALELPILAGVWVSAAPAQDQAASQSVLPADLARTAAAYNIDIVAEEIGFPIRTTWGMIHGDLANKVELERYARLFVPEFGLYPPDLIRRTKLKRVSLCTDLSFAGQQRNAIPDYENKTLYLDVSRGSYSPLYLRKVIHHEFFHIIDFFDDGQVYEDASWRVLNPGAFQYQGGGRIAQGSATTGDLTTRFSGFLNHYSTTGVEEDKAEMFANMVVECEYVGLRSINDAVVRAKIERMKALLLDFCPAMDGTFWERAAKVDRLGE